MNIKSYFAKDISDTLIKNTILYFALWSAVFLVFIVVQFLTPNLSGRDAYYHIRYAEWIRDHGIYDFKWLPYSILRPETYTDHHLLYHLILVPFTFYKSKLIGIKISIALFQSILFMVFYWITLDLKVQYPFIFSIVLFVASPSFLYRTGQGRVQTLSLTFLVAISWIIISQRKRILLFVLSSLYVWLVDAYLYAVVFLGFYALASFLSKEKQDKKIYLIVLGGILLGHILNPYFPKNILYEVKHFASKIDVNGGLPVGNEWYPLKSSYFFAGQTLLYLFMIAGVITHFLFPPKDKKRQRDILYYFIATVFMIVLSAKSRRFLEYLPPFPLLFAGLCFQELRMFKPDVSTKLRDITIIFLLFIIFPFGIRTLRTHIRDLKDNFHFYRKSGCALWLKDNLPENEIIYTSNWDDFPELLFYDTNHRFVTGLDAYYLYYYNKEMSNKWWDISYGRVKNPSKLIKNTFKSRAVFTVNDRKDFIKSARSDSQMKEVYSDKHCTVFLIE